MALPPGLFSPLSLPLPLPRAFFHVQGVGRDDTETAEADGQAGEHERA